MKLKKIVNKAKQGTVSFFKDPKKVQGLAIGIVGTLTAALLVDEVKTSKHKKEVKELKNHYLDFGYGEGTKHGNLLTLEHLNLNNKISKEDAILYGKEFDCNFNDLFHENDVITKNYNKFSDRNQERFENRLN